MRAAIVEFNYYHDEVIPTLVHCLNRLGVEPDVYSPRRAARKNAFAFTPHLRFRLRITDSWSRVLGIPSRLSRYDFVVVNSIEPDETLAAASRIRLPTIAIQHNADLLAQDRYQRYFDQPSRHPLFLARHIASSAGERFADCWIAPVDLGSVPRAREDGRAIINLCVPGNIHLHRRDYPSLVTSIAELASERSDIHIRFVGRSNNVGGDTVRALLQERGVMWMCSFTGSEITYAEYASLVAGSDFILPLLDSTSGRYEPYYVTKLASAINMAISVGVIPVTDRRLADLYGIGGGVVNYEAGMLTEGIRQALGLSPMERLRRRRVLNDARASALATSVDNLAAVIKRIGV